MLFVPASSNKYPSMGQVHIVLRTSHFHMICCEVSSQTMLAKSHFTADHMKMECPEDDVNLTVDMICCEEGRYKQHLSDAEEFKRCPHLRP